MASRVITEADVRAQSGRAPIVVDESTAITPSALDLADRRGIPVIWKRGGPAQAGGAGASEPAEGPRLDPPLRGLPDGDYLVRVRGGRARVWRLVGDGREIPVETAP